MSSRPEPAPVLKGPGMTIAYLAKAKYGGWPTFLRHLHVAMTEVGMGPAIRVVGARTAGLPHEFGHGLRARRMTLPDLCRATGPVLIAAADKDHADAARQLVERGAYIVVHDPAEKHLAGFPQDRMIVIRESMLRHAPKATFIRHPYRRDKPGRRSMYEAVAHSRIDFDKYTHLILAANDLGANIRIFGAANTRYIFLKIASRWPDFKPERFPMEAGAGAALCASAEVVVDMSAIANDGGGTQYSFLEAWDAGTPLVINAKWTAGYPDGDMQHGKNCLVAADETQIAAAVKLLREDKDLRAQVIAEGRNSLLRHEPRTIGLQYKQAMRL